jgi:hypothetical protein
MKNRDASSVNSGSRRAFLAATLAAPLWATEVSAARQTAGLKVASPDGKVEFQLLPQPARLSYRVSFKNQPVIEASPFGFSIDGVELTQGVEVGQAERYRLNERYRRPFRGHQPL